jgi:hypothetical protein
MQNRMGWLLLAVAAALAAPAASKWVYFGEDHKLHYRTDERGNRIVDFSYAGYRGGGVRLPNVPTSKTLAAVGGDNTAQIQEALDAASRLPLNAGGFRGAVVLQPGTFEVDGTLRIAASGVVLRGSGSGGGGTNIQLGGTPHRFLEIRGNGAPQADGNSVGIKDAYVPSGAALVHVQNGAAFHAGDTVLVIHPVTEAWVHFMGMDALVRDGKQQTWIKAGSAIRTDRVVEAVNGDAVTLDVPLTDNLDAQFLQPGGARLVKYAFPGRISEVGVENMRIAAPSLDVPITEGQYTVFRMDAVMDAWARDIVVQETQNGIVIGSAAKRITLDQIRINHAEPHSGAAAPADFSLAGSQILLARCAVNGEGTWPVVTQASVSGPNVVLNFSGDAHAGISPHQRWATGLLVDSARLPNTVQRTPGIAFSNRKTAGSGHGWDAGWSVAWNVASPFLLVQQPPGSMNWCIGCTGEEITKDDRSGIFDSRGVPVEPASLYLEQLRERLGEQALVNIGYGGK